MSETLKPCPFCGGKAEISMFLYHGEERYYAECSNYTCTVKPRTITTFKTEEEVIAAWNKRFGEKRIQALEKALKMAGQNITCWACENRKSAFCEKCRESSNWKFNESVFIKHAEGEER
jgi:Lar family restriction alleviation protein